MSAIEFPGPPAVRFSGSRLARWVLKQIGWRVKFDGLPTQQGVLVVYPHTSNWDFVILVIAKWAVGISVSFWAKDKLFRVPIFAPWLRWLGGIPVNRTSPRGTVGQAVDRFAQARSQGRYFWLALSPEGASESRDGAVAFTRRPCEPVCRLAWYVLTTAGVKCWRRTSYP